MEEREKICEYPPRFQIKYEQTADSLEPLYFSFVVSKKTENKETKNKEVKQVGQFSFVKKPTGKELSYFCINNKQGNK